MEIKSEMERKGEEEEKKTARAKTKREEESKKKRKNEAVDPAVVVAEFGWTSHGILWARYGVYEGRSRV